jgi:hypothetical protein
MPGWRCPAAKVFEECPFRAQYLDGAGRKAGQALETARLSDETGGELRAEKGRYVGRSRGRGDLDRFRQREPGRFDRTKELGETPAGLGQRRVPRREGRRGIGSERLAGRSVMITRIDVRAVTRHPCSEAFSDQVPDAVEVRGGTDRLLDMDARIPADLQRPLGFPQQERPLEGRVDPGSGRVDRPYGGRVKSKPMFGEPSVAGHPIG